MALPREKYQEFMADGLKNQSDIKLSRGRKTDQLGTELCSFGRCGFLIIGFWAVVVFLKAS